MALPVSVPVGDYDVVVVGCPNKPQQVDVSAKPQTRLRFDCLAA